MENIVHLEFAKEYDVMLNKLAEYDNKLTSINKTFSYGTSGFRYPENELDKIAFRVAIVSCLKSQCLDGLPIGIMITASHNKYIDNGFKIAGVDGEMITTQWEDIYTKLVNSKDLVSDTKLLIEELYNNKLANSKYFFRDVTPIVNYACDTRRSSPILAKIIG